MRKNIHAYARHRMTREDYEAVILARPGGAYVDIRYDRPRHGFVATISDAAPGVVFTGRGQTPREAFDAAYAQVQR